MATLVRPPPAAVKTGRDNRPYFTLHKSPNSVMAWGTNTTKMAIVAFKRPHDVQFMGNTIEHHYSKVREWPDFTNEIKMVGGVTRPVPLDILDVWQWSNLDELRVFCVQKYFDLIIVDKISDTFNITGAIYSLSIPPEAYVPRLENLLLLSDRGEI
jgi:hypothetical protein